MNKVISKLLDSAEIKTIQPWIRELFKEAADEILHLELELVVAYQQNDGG